MKKKYIVLGILFLSVIVSNYSISNKTKNQSLSLANIGAFATANAEWSDGCNPVWVSTRCYWDGVYYTYMERK